ncbi:unnamed protein product [Owenia fusiformis]|uniref:Uncharacterized protein n=1 Tax=Owenia fusiformis TaxID=6347 RepID=A0A8J1TWD0_OWEFU|nr:unnamed protein product [Owenia fusiformis]
MPQEFQVLQCYSCKLFQVHQVKKVKKWNCKVCGEKQSIIKVFGCGTGADCRKHVQKLNMIRGSAQESEETTQPPVQSQSYIDMHRVTNEDQPTNFQSASKWETFIEKEDGHDDMAEHDVSHYTTDRNAFNQAKKEVWKDKKNRYKSQQNQDVEAPRSQCFNRTAPYSKTKPYNKQYNKETQQAPINITNTFGAPIPPMRTQHLPVGAEYVKVTRNDIKNTADNQKLRNNQLQDENPMKGVSNKLTESSSLKNNINKPYNKKKTLTSKPQVVSSSKWAMFTEQANPSDDDNDDEDDDSIEQPENNYPGDSVNMNTYKFERAENNHTPNISWLKTPGVDHTNNCLSPNVNSHKGGSHTSHSYESFSSHVNFSNVKHDTEPPHNVKPHNINNLFNVILMM